MEAGLLRDTSRLTRLLVLLEVHRRRPSKLQPVADALGITSQAVSTYMRALQEDELLARREGAYVVTREGLQTLQESLQDLKRVVDDAVARLAHVDVTAAVADAPLGVGEGVSLVLREGVLHASPTDAGSSRGTVLRGGEEGDDVAVTDLEGVVDLTPGRLTVLRVPTVDRGGSRTVDLEVLDELLQREEVGADRVAVEGVEARVLARRAGLGIDLAFAPVEASHAAAVLGLDVLLLASDDRLKDILATLDHLAEGALEPVPVDILRAPEVAA